MEEAPYLVAVRANGEVHQFPFCLGMTERTKVEAQIRAIARNAKAAGADWVGLKQGDRVLLRGKLQEDGGWLWES